MQAPPGRATMFVRLVHEGVVAVLLSILVLGSLGVVRLMAIPTMPGRFYIMPVLIVAAAALLLWKIQRRPAGWGMVAAAFLLMTAGLLVLATRYSLVHLATGQFVAVRMPRFVLDTRTSIRLGYAAVVAAAAGSISLRWLRPRRPGPPTGFERSPGA